MTSEMKERERGSDGERERDEFKQEYTVVEPHQYLLRCVWGRESGSAQGKSNIEMGLWPDGVNSALPSRSAGVRCYQTQRPDPTQNNPSNFYTLTQRLHLCAPFWGFCLFKYVIYSAHVINIIIKTLLTYSLCSTFLLLILLSILKCCKPFKVFWGKILQHCEIKLSG